GGAGLTFSLSDATGISPTRPAPGAPAGASCGAAAAVIGVVGRERPANAHRGGGGRRPGGPLCGDRRLQANRGAGATGAGHGGSGGVADERGCGRAAGPPAAPVRTRDGAGGGRGIGGVWGGGRAETDQAAGTRGEDPGTGGDEVSGASGTPKPGGLPADGRHLRRTPLRYAPSRPTVCGVAQGVVGGPQTHSGRSRAVFQNATASAGESGRDRRRTVTRFGNGGGDCEPRETPAGGRGCHAVG